MASRPCSGFTSAGFHLQSFRFRPSFQSAAEKYQRFNRFPPKMTLNHRYGSINQCAHLHWGNYQFNLLVGAEAASAPHNRPFSLQFYKTAANNSDVFSDPAAALGKSDRWEKIWKTSPSLIPVLILVQF